MRTLVREISVYGKGKHPGLIVIPQNGQELFTDNGQGDGIPYAEYLSAIDGTGREDFRYGYTGDNQPTPIENFNQMKGLLEVGEANGVESLVIDYCSSAAKMQDSYTLNHSDGYLSFAADHRELDNIPAYPAQPYLSGNHSVTSLYQAKNFLYLINPQSYSSKAEFLAALQNTDYDAIILDLFFNEESLTASDILSLKTKKNGGNRLIICYMSIGEAENYRFYWQSEWKNTPPIWLDKENPAWKGNYKVRYWIPEWKSVIMGNSEAYLDRILAAEFDGVYLDIIDAFDYFEG